jgi:WD40 repeat protein
MSFYNTKTRELTGSYDEVTVWQSEFSPDGKQLAVSAQEPTVRLVDAVTLQDEPVQLGGIPENAYPGHPRYSADGRFMVVSFGLEGGEAAVVWDLDSPRQPVRRVDLPGAGEGAGLSPDGSLLYVGRSDPARLTVFEVATGRSLGSTTSVPADTLDVSPDGSLIAAVAGNDIVLLDAATLTVRGRLRGHSDEIKAMRFSHSGSLLASGSADRTVVVWDVATGQPREELHGHVGAVWGVDFSPDDKTLYSAGLDGALLIWDLVGDRRFIARHPIVEPVTFAPRGSIGSPSGETVAYTDSAPNDVALLQFLDMRTGRVGDVIDTHHRFYGDSVWRPDGRRFATAGDDGAIRVWDGHTGDLVAERYVTGSHISSLDYTDDGRRLIVAEGVDPTDGANAVFTVDAETLQVDGPRIELVGYIRWIRASSDNHTAIALLDQGRFALIDVNAGRVLHEGEVGFIPDPSAFSPDGHRVAVSGIVGELRVLDVDTAEWVGPPRAAHRGGSWQVSYAPDGATFATGGWDGTIALWDGDTGAPLGRVRPGPHTDAQPQFLSDGHTVLISTHDGTVYTWDTRPETWVDAACAIAGRNLTPDEWSDTFGSRPYRPTCPTTDAS